MPNVVHFLPYEDSPNDRRLSDFYAHRVASDSHSFSAPEKPHGQSSSVSSSSVIHSGPHPPFVCNICGKSFMQANSLKLHGRIHSGERPYSCRICGKTFSYSSNLRDHERIHTGERPYVCKICKKGFTQSSHLKAHKRLHSGERPYVCRICNKSFIVSSLLRKHELVHQK